MNKIYKVIWSKVRNCYVAVSEIAKRNGKSCTSVNCGAKANRGHAGVALSAAVGATLLAGVCSVLLPVRVALAAPVMPTLDYKGASAYVTIDDKTTANTMNITSTKTNNVLKWIDFSIGKGGTVQFDPNNYLNYVTGHGRSEIDGILKQTKNDMGNRGSIYIVNPNGVLFGDNARVDVGSLYVSTRDISDKLSSFDTAVGALFPATYDNAAVGDVINLGKLNADVIQVEGKNISFKNVADVTKGGTLTDGDITGNAIQVHNDISVTLTANSTGEIHIGSSNGGTPGYSMNGTSKTYMYKLVSTPNELQAIGNNDTTLAGNYMLANDIDFNDDPNFTTGFKPIGYKDNSTSDGVRHSFSGKFDGLNYEIKNLKITDASLSNTTDLSLDVKEHVGLFGDNIGTIENVGVVGTDINVSKGVTGGIVGYNNGGTIRNVYHTGSVLSSNLKVGGIAGANTGVIEKAYNTGTVDGTVDEQGQIGGIVGSDTGGTIREVYNASDVGYINTTSSALGGIVGYANRATTVEDAYNSGSITGRSQAGGIIGFVNHSSDDVKSKIKRSYNTGNVKQGEGDGGGIVGRALLPSDVQIESSFFSKGTNTYGGTLKSEEELKKLSTFSDDWNSNSTTISATGGAKTTWRIYEGQTTPLLTAFLKTKDVITETEYNGTEQSFDENLVTGDSHIIPTDVGGYAKQTDAGKYNGLTEGKVLYSDQLGYDLVDTRLIIQPKRVSLVNADKTYDGTKDVNTSTLNLNTADIIGSDSAKVTLVNNNVTGTYADKNAGDGKAITYTIADDDGALTGTAKGNYIISAVGTGNITAKTLNLVSVSKVYDGTANVEAGDIGITETDIVTNDINKVTFDSSKVTGSYADKNVGTSKGVTYTVNAGALTGAEAGNYVISTAGTGEILKADVTLTVENVVKTYDGTTAVTGKTLMVKSGSGTIFDSDSLGGGTFAFTDKNVGDGNKRVTVGGGTITDKTSGVDTSGNYNITYADNTTSTINKANITLTAEDVTKTYDGTTTVAAADGKLKVQSGTIFTGDSMGGGTFAFTDKNAGTGNKTVTVTGATISDGTNSGNYNITYANNTTSTINKANITLTAEDVTKTYDGTTTVAAADGKLKVQSGTIFTGDSMSGGTFAFTNKNVGTGNKVVTVTDATISDGNGGENYNVTYENNTTSTIMTKALSVGNVTKEYDGNATASLTVSNLLGVEECDKTGLSISAGVVANYTNNTGDKDANAGTEKRVDYSSLTLSGAEAGNYTIDASGTSTTGNSITARLLTMGSVSKVYDGTDNALVSVYALTNAIEDDLLDLSFKGTSRGKYSGKNVGDNLTVTYTDLILEGAKAGNYTIDSDAVVTGNSITPKELTLVADKVSIKSGETIPTSFTGDVIGFLEGEGLVSLDDLKFELATPSPTMAGSYAIVGKLKSASGDYLANGVYSTDNTPPNYTFSNAPANEKAFTIAVDVMPQLDYRGASIDVTIDTATTANTMAISSIKSNNVLKWIDFSIGSGGTVQFDAKNYLNYVTGHGRSEIYGTLTGGGDIYLINPNGMLFGSTAQVNVGNLYLSTRSFDVDDELDDKLNDYLNNRTIPTGSTILGDVTNLGKLNTNGVVNPNTNVLTNTIEVEGKNISIKNIADVTTGGTLTNGTLSGGSMHNNVKLTSGDGEIHLGFAVSDTPAEGVNDTQYTNVTPPSLEGWTTTGTTHKYMLVHNAYELQNINNNLTGNYMLANDIDFIDENGNWTIRYFKSLGSKGNNWGSRTGMFQGRLDGLNHVIRNINITNTNNESYSTDVGIIGSNAGIVENFGVVNGNIVLSSKSWVGGIVGANKGCGIIRNVYFSGLVEGSSNVGGIAGAQDGSNTQPGVPLPGGIIEKAYASGTVRSNNSNGGSYVGGIVGSNGKGARVSEAYNSANVSTKAGGRYTGGIVGSNSGTIVNAYNTGAVEGGTYVGGIAGSNSSNSSNSSNIIIQNTYNTGTVSGTSNFGGIVGYNSGTAPISSFFTQGNDNDLGKQISDSELKEFATFAGSSLAASKRWNMSQTGGTGKVWRIYEGQTGPLLTAFLKTKDVVTATEYNGEEQTFDNTLAQGAANHIYATDSGNLVKGTDAWKYFGNNTDNNNSGYKVYYSDQGGYDIGDTILVIQPKKLTVGNVTKVYDGTADAAEAFTLDNLDVVAADKTETGLTLAVTSATYNDKNADVNKTITYTGITLGGTRADNYVIHSNTIGTGTIEKKLITANFAAISKTYDGTTNDVDGGAVVASRIQAATVSDGVVAADEGKVNVAGVAAYDEKNAGTRTVNYTSVELSGDEASNYSVAETATGSGTINKAKVTLTVEDVTKTYDGTTAVTGKTLMVKPGSGTTIFASDNLSGGTFAFTDKNVGTGNKTVTVAGGTITDTTSGADTSGNYIITYENNTKSTITQAPITLSVADGYSRAYNGTADASGATTTVTSGEVFTGDSILSITKEYSDKNVGTGKTITISNAVIGDGAGNNSNYDISYVTNTGAITQAPITLSVADGYSRAYNGTADASGATTTVTSGEVFTGDSILSITKEYSDKNVGTGKTITVSNAVIGDGAGNNSNYDISYADGSGQVTTANLTLTAEDVTKIYDGTTDVAAADGKLKIVSGQLFGTDKMSGGMFAFTNKNAGTGNKVVTITDATISDGNSGGNYNVTYADNTTSTINKADLTLTAEDVVKTYDGTTVVTGGTLKVLSGTLFTGDSIGGGTFAFTDKNAGTGNKIVTVTDATISDGNGGGNYNVTYANNTTSTINKKALTATFADISKTYDGTTNATPGAGTLTGVVAVDAGKVSVSASAAYDEKNAGNRTVNYTGVTLSGAEAGNYSIATTATGNGTIGRKALELVADPANTEYGDYNPASFTGRVDGFVTGESVSNGDTLLFALSDPSASAVGSYGITGTINGSSSGDYGLNYTFTNAASNANAFTIYARPASVQDMVLSDIIPGIKGKSGADISVTALDNAMEQARDKRAEVGIEFAVAQTILSVDADRNLSLENRGMKQPPAMTPQEVAEQVHAQQGNGNGVAAQAGGNAGAASGGTNENGAASNAGVTGAVNAAMDVVQQTDDAVGTEESKRKKGVA